jgi:indole-3-glycerol phosphate synthase/phosphoribosylanthranilate isomerase
MDEKFSPKLKVCGVTRLEDATALVARNVPYIGVIVEVQGTPRSVERSKALAIAGCGPRGTVFVLSNPDAALVRVLLESAPIALQFHGCEEPEFLVELRALLPKKTEIWKALPVVPETVPERYAEAVDRFVLERPKTVPQAGPFPFALTLALMKRASRPVLVAGGLGPKNVREVVRCLRPYGVDMASGVEEAPGIKDMQAIDEVLVALSAQKVLFVGHS